MKRKSSFLFSLAILGGMAYPAMAQEQRPSPAEPDILGPQLIAWSELQKPQPIPQPQATPKPTAESDDKAQEPSDPPAQPAGQTDPDRDQSKPR